MSFLIFFNIPCKSIKICTLSCHLTLKPDNCRALQRCAECALDLIPLHPLKAYSSTILGNVSLLHQYSLMNHQDILSLSSHVFGALSPAPLGGFLSHIPVHKICLAILVLTTFLMCSWNLVSTILCEPSKHSADRRICKGWHL